MVKHHLKTITYYSFYSFYYIKENIFIIILDIYYQIIINYHSYHLNITNLHIKINIIKSINSLIIIQIINFNLIFL